MPKNELGFTDQTIRAAFVRKVFLLVAVMVSVQTLFSHLFLSEQLGVVTVMCALPYMHQPLMTYARNNLGLYLIALVTFLVVYLTLICCEGVRRTFPTK